MSGMFDCKCKGSCGCHSTAKAPAVHGGPSISAKSAPGMAGHGSDRLYPKGGGLSMSPDFNPRANKPRAL